MQSSHIKPTEPAWHVFDAENKVLGRLATEIATTLRGKNKPSFVPYLDCGDHVVVINASKIILTGNKMNDKAYHHYSGYPGGMKSHTVKDVIKEHPERVIEAAVKGMLPKNKLQGDWMLRLHVYGDNEHPHQANTANLKSK